MMTKQANIEPHGAGRLERGVRHGDNMKLPDWEPSDIFYWKVDIRIDEIKGGGLFGGNSYPVSYDKNYTRLGDLFTKIPGIIALPIIVMYYMIAYPIWVAYEFLRAILWLLTEPVFRRD
jgi:hypothetical protein